MSDSLLQFGLTLIRVTLVCLLFFFTFFVIFRLLDHFQKEQIKGEVPFGFPVLVMTAERAQVIWSEDLQPFREAHPDSSFLVPLNRVDVYREQIRVHYNSGVAPRNSSDASVSWPANFKVGQLSEGKQSFEVEVLSDDYVIIGWYEATDKEIFPRFHKYYFGPGVAVAAALIAALLTSVFWRFAGRTGFEWLQRRVKGWSEA